MAESTGPAQGEGVGAGQERRRRRRRSQDRRPAGVRGFFERGKATRLMLLIGLLFVLVNAYSTRARLTWYSGFVLWMSPDDVSYAMGRPTRVAREGGDQLWTYENSSRVETLRFENGILTSGTCRSKAAVTSCPDILGISDGTSEIEIFQKLGQPSRQWYRGSDKYLRYDELGLTFALNRYRVFEVGLSAERASFPRVVLRFLRLMLP